MKFSALSFLATAILAAGVNASSESKQEAQAGCTLTGTYVSGTDVSTCDTVVISSLQVPAGVTLDLTKLKSGATVTFTGTTTFGPKFWEGPLVLLTGTNLKVNGPGTLDGQGAWYWPKGQTVTRPVFFRLNHVDFSTISGFTVKNSPFRTFSILGSTNTLLTGLTLDSKAGDGIAKNTDGFDLGRSTGVNITNNIVFNQDDCFATGSSVNTLVADNTCTGGHGISIGSIGGPVLDRTNTVQNLIVRNNKIINNKHGLRIKTIIGLKGLVTGVQYIKNTLTNVKNGIVVRSDYNKTQGGYSGNPTSEVTISDITIAGLNGTATNFLELEVFGHYRQNYVQGVVPGSTQRFYMCLNMAEEAVDDRRIVGRNVKESAYDKGKRIVIEAE
ncbi:unnamed protein product [Aphanomyces euteiches]